MKLFGRELEGSAKALVVLAATLLVSLGICGVNSVVETKNGWDSFHPGLPDTFVGNTLGFLDFVCFFASWIAALGILIVSILWMLYAIVNHFTKPPAD
jgi:hypothetical protein